MGPRVGMDEVDEENNVTSAVNCMRDVESVARCYPIRLYFRQVLHFSDDGVLRTLHLPDSSSSTAFGKLGHQD